jgi:hypothetical protein
MGGGGGEGRCSRRGHRWEGPGRIPPRLFKFSLFARERSPGRTPTTQTPSHAPLLTSTRPPAGAPAQDGAAATHGGGEGETAERARRLRRAQDVHRGLLPPAVAVDREPDSLQGQAIRPQRTARAANVCVAVCARVCVVRPGDVPRRRGEALPARQESCVPLPPHHPPLLEPGAARHLGPLQADGARTPSLSILTSLTPPHPYPRRPPPLRRRRSHHDVRLRGMGRHVPDLVEGLGRCWLVAAHLGAESDVVAGLSERGQWGRRRNAPAPLASQPRLLSHSI